MLVSNDIKLRNKQDEAVAWSCVMLDTHWLGVPTAGRGVATGWYIGIYTLPKSG